MHRLALSSSLRAASGVSASVRRAGARNFGASSALCAKDVRFGTEVRQEMLKGVDTLADAVSVTMVPKVRHEFLNSRQ